MAENNAVAEQLNPQEQAARPEIEEITIKFAKGLVGEPFTSKKGVELVEIKIPNQDENDHSPWESFVLGVKQVHEDQFGGKGMWAKLPKDGHTTVSKPHCTVLDNGAKEWSSDRRVVSNVELKEMVEFYKTRGHGDGSRGNGSAASAPRDSALGALEASKKAAAMAPKPFVPSTEEMPFR